MEIATYKKLDEAWNDAVRSLCESLGHKGTCSVYQLEKYSRPRFRKSNRYIISGVSGSGKTTFGKMLEYLAFRKLPTAIVRVPRPEEIQGLDYIFLKEDTFRQWRESHEFFFSHITNGNLHGFLRSHLSVLKSGGGKFYLDKSVRSTRQLFPYLKSSCMLIYLLPPSLDELYIRLKNREALASGLNDQEIISRFQEEIDELRQSAELPYTYVVNDNVGALLNLLSKV